MGAARVFDFIEQVQSEDTCPVLINKDLPKGGGNTTNRALVAHGAQQMFKLGSEDDGWKQELSVRFGETLDPLIVGGLNASENLVPYMAVVVTTTRSVCSAAFISPRWIISAAHCQVFPGSSVFPNLGALTTLQSPNITVKRSFLHPQFNLSGGSNYYDVLVAELEEEAPSDVRFMKVNAKVSVPKDNEPVRAIGYGRTSPDDRSRGAILRQVDLRVMSNEECGERLQELAFPRPAIGRIQLCAKSLRERCGIW